MRSRALIFDDDGLGRALPPLPGVRELIDPDGAEGWFIPPGTGATPESLLEVTLGLS